MRPRGSAKRRTGLSLLALAVCALASAAASAAASFDAAGLRALMMSRGFSASQAQAVIATLERAEARQLPVAVLENRLREGLARRAAPATILAVLDERQAGLARADQLARRSAGEGIGVRARNESLARLADAFSMGVSPADVDDLVPAAVRAGRDLDDVSRSAEVMGRLARLGFRPPDTRDVVQAALVERWSRTRLDGLVAVFVKARSVGLAPGRTRALLVAGIREGKDPGRLGDDVATARAESSASPSRAGAANGKGKGRDVPPEEPGGHGQAPVAKEPAPQSHPPNTPAPDAPGSSHPATPAAPHTPAPHTPAPHTPAPRTPAPHAPRVPVPRPPMPHH